MRPRPLSPKQKNLLTLLKENSTNPLTIREIQDEMGFSSTSIVAHHLGQLEKKGYLKRNPQNPRDYTVLDENPESLVVYLNMYGLAQCGPDGTILDGEVLDKIPISSRLLGFPSSEAFMVRAKGDSMNPKIQDGDVVIARKTQAADSGRIVVCVNNETAMIKKYQRTAGGAVVLNSLNMNYEPIVAAEDFRIEGEVRNILTSVF